MELTQSKKASYVPIGFAIFSMFFGAGNSIFPLLVGTEAGSKNLLSISGLFITALLIPMLGLYGMVLYKGDYKSFFYRLGKAPGFFLICLIMIVIGPFAGIPRCITLAFGTLKPYIGTTPLMAFSISTCALVFFKTIKKSRLIDILGKVLTPLLLACLSVVIIKGLMGANETFVSNASSTQAFLSGLTTGYQMMDLLASFFFATTVITCLKEKESTMLQVEPVHKSKTMLKAILLAASLLGIIYLGFSYVGAFHSASFHGLSKASLISAIGLKILGPQLGFIMAIAFTLACLTTIITLVSVFSDFLYKECFSQKLPYVGCILVTLLAAFFFSNLGFEGICRTISPLLNICYPSLIALTFLNILNKQYNFKWVKVPVLLVFVGSLLSYFIV